MLRVLYPKWPSSFLQFLRRRWELAAVVIMSEGRVVVGVRVVPGLRVVGPALRAQLVGRSLVEGPRPLLA